MGALIMILLEVILFIIVVPWVCIICTPFILATLFVIGFPFLLYFETLNKIEIEDVLGGKEGLMNESLKCKKNAKKEFTEIKNFELGA